MRARLEQPLAKGAEAPLVRVGLHGFVDDVEEERLLARVGQLRVEEGGVEGAVEPVGGVGIEACRVRQHHERLHRRAERGGVGAPEERRELGGEEVARLVARRRVVAKGDGAVEAREDHREHARAERLPVRRPRREEREEDEEQRVREGRVGAREDHLVHEDARVVLARLGHVGAEDEALDLGEDDALHRRVVHRQLPEQVRDLRRRLLVGVAEFVDERREEAALELGLRREEGVERADHALLDVRGGVVHARLDDRDELGVAVLEFRLKVRPGGTPGSQRQLRRRRRLVLLLLLLLLPWVQDRRGMLPQLLDEPRWGGWRSSATSARRQQPLREELRRGLRRRHPDRLVRLLGEADELPQVWRSGRRTRGSGG